MMRKLFTTQNSRGQRHRKQTRYDNNSELTDNDASSFDSNSTKSTESDPYGTDFHSEIVSEIEMETDARSFTSNKPLIDRQEQMLEAIVDTHIVTEKGEGKALLHVVKERKKKLLLLVNNLLQQGASTSVVDSKGKTPLHYAAKRGLRAVAAKLLEHNASTTTRDKKEVLPFGIAFKDENDDMCALLLNHMPNEFVRSLFTGGTKKAECSLHKLLQSKTSMQQTILSVLNCMLEETGSFNSCRVYYNILESDESGRPPTHPLFEKSEKSPFQIIAKQGNREIVYHGTVRLLVRRKWKAYAKQRFVYNTLAFVLALICITFSAIVSVTAKDATVYNDPLQIARAVLEVVSLVIVFITLLKEIHQLCRRRREYFHDKFNWLDLSSSVLLLTVPVLRFTHTNAEWYVFAFGYLLWTIRIFKYAAGFRRTAYAQILGDALLNDFLHFGVLFLVMLLAFSVSFYLSLKGDGDLEKHVETSTFWGILFVGIRTLIEAAPVVEYTGPDGFAPVSAIFMVAFLFTCIVILLNILIAQLSDSYKKANQDAERGIEVNRAWITAKVELHSILFTKNIRYTYYVQTEDIKNIRAALEESEIPQSNEINKNMQTLLDSLENHKMNLLTVQHRMAYQGETLHNIRESFENHRILLRNVQYRILRTVQHRMARQEETLQNIQEELKCLQSLIQQSYRSPSATQEDQDVTIPLTNNRFDNKETITETEL